MSEKKTPDNEIFPDALPIGNVLHGRFRVDRVLGEGGFGITYIGYDTSLMRETAIKEYFPRKFSVRAADGVNVRSYSGDLGKRFSHEKDKFIGEARRTAKFSKSPGVVSIIDYFEENGTAYIVMELLEGKTLGELLRERGTLSEEETLELLKPVIYSIKELHEAHIIHRDIAPDNIMIQPDGSAKLIDFGASADLDIEPGENSELIVKVGYVPMEQYDHTRKTQGPWTDIYALCATIYKCLTGELIPDALTRVRTGTPLAKLPESVRTRDAIMKGLEVKDTDRTRSMDELIKAFYGGGGGNNPIILISIIIGIVVITAVIVVFSKLLGVKPAPTPEETTTTVKTTTTITTTEPTTTTVPPETTTRPPVTTAAYNGNFLYEDYREKYSADIENDSSHRVYSAEDMCVINPRYSFMVVDAGKAPINPDEDLYLWQIDLFGEDINIDLLDFYMVSVDENGNRDFSEVIPSRSINADGENLTFPLYYEKDATFVLGFEVPVGAVKTELVFAGTDMNLTPELTGTNGITVIVEAEAKEFKAE
jgi:serine/threonine protein kinase